MDIPLDAEAECADGPCGWSTHVVIDPNTEKVTHLVVREQESSHIERLIPIELVVESTPGWIRLRCNRRELNNLEPFTVTEFVRSKIPRYQAGSNTAWPFAVPETRTKLFEFESAPPGELAVRRGAGVQATDGKVGAVDELLVNPGDGHITHIVLREGLLWAKKKVVVPISVIDRIEEDTVYLKLDKHSIKVLPPVSVKKKSVGGGKWISH